MLQVVGRKGQRRPQVILREVRVGFEQICKGAASAQLAQDQLHRDARAFDTWLAHHDGRIGGDTGVWHVRSAFIDVAVTGE